MYAQVGHGGEEGCDGAEGREAVAKLDREAADGGAVDVAHLHREIAREEEEVAERLERELRVWAWAARGAQRAHEGEVRDGKVLQVGQHALAKDDVVRAGPRQVFDRRVRLEEPLRVLVRVERPTPAQVEFYKGGKSTVVQQGGYVGGVADEVWQVKDLWFVGYDRFCEKSVDERLTCKSVEDIRAVRNGLTYFLSQGIPVNTADLRLGSSQTTCDSSSHLARRLGHRRCAYLGIFKVSLDINTAGPRRPQY